MISSSLYVIQMGSTVRKKTKEEIEKKRSAIEQFSEKIVIQFCDKY